MKKSAALLPLCAGLALGATGAWSLRRLAAAPPTPISAVSSARADKVPGPTEIPVARAPALILPPPLADAEADAALAAYLALPPLPDQAPATEIQDRLLRLRALLTLLPTPHLERLLAALAIRVGGAEAQLRRAAFDIWTERDAPAAARWALALVPGEAINAGARNRYASQAALAWARDDFSAAYAWASSLADTKLGRDLAGRMLGQLAATDPRQALALLQAGDEEFVRGARNGVFQAWAKHDPAAALRALGPSLLEARNHDWNVQEALAKWTARDPSAALDWMIAQPVPAGESHRSPLNNLSWSITENPDAVRPFLELLARREDVPDRAGVIQNIFATWARKDSDSALAWLDTVSDVAQRSDLVTRAMDTIDQERPDEFMKLARLLPPSAERDAKIAGRLSQWAEADPDAALAWLAKHDGPELSTAAPKVEGTLLASLAKTDPAAALARWQSLPADAHRADIAVQLASNWARTDPAAATRWFAQQIPGDPAKDPAALSLSYALQPVALRWARQDPLGFVEWSKSLPNDFQREAAINALINSPWHHGANEIDPPPRAPFANQLARIDDPAIRERALSSHLRQWMRSDLQAARAWIESSEALSPEAAARLLTDGASAAN